MEDNAEKLERTIAITFQNKNLLKEAITHRSYLNENPSWRFSHNERLEFLGDAVLELVVTEDLFERFPDFPEGQLTNIRAALVNYQMIAKVARDMELEKFILMSKGEAKDVGRAREVILANAWEALIGAVHLDGGYEAAKQVIERFLLTPYCKEIVEKGLYKDPKSELQEIVQEQMKLTPRYEVMKEWGPDHAKQFRVGVYFNGEVAAQGQGFSKQEAEVDAARNALQLLAKKKK